MADSLIGKTLGNCRIVKKIGQGGMGTVYQAQHLGLNKTVAVKVLPPSFALEEERVKRFIREARAAAQLEHIHIVQVFNIAKQDDLYFIVMQYVDGVSMAQKIKQQGQLSVNEATRIIKEAATGLKVAHQRGIIHRDIKPENIMLTKQDDVKIMDFGLARMSDGFSHLSHSGDILGTPYYLSPEQAQGKTVDPRTDIYSLGISYYYALTGRQPFEGDTPVSVIMKHINEEPVNPRQLLPDLPQRIVVVLKKMMAKKVEARYQNMDGLIQDLDSILSEITTPTPATIKVSRAMTLATSKYPRIKYLVVGAIVLFAFLLIMAALSNKDKQKQEIPLPVPPVSVPQPISAVPSSVSVEVAFNKIKEHIKTHASLEETDNNIKMLQDFIQQFPESEESKDAAHLIERIQRYQELHRALKTRINEFATKFMKKDYEGMLSIVADPGSLNHFQKERFKRDIQKTLQPLFSKGKVTDFRIEKMKILLSQEPKRAMVEIHFRVELKDPSADPVWLEQNQAWVFKNNIWYLQPDKKEPRKPNRRKH